MPLSEETITEIILLNIADRLRGHVAILPFNKRQEGKIGADWEWCLYDDRSKLYFRMLVQAKRLGDNGHEYPHLDYKIGTSSVRQIDKFIDSARSRRIPAVYAFYNFSHAVHSGFADDCNCYQNSCWGVSIAEATQVRVNLAGSNAKRFDAISGFSMPWHLLTCCCNSRFSGLHGDIANSAFRALQRLRRFAGVTEESVDPVHIDPPTTIPPSYIEEALSSLSGEPLSDERIARLRAQNSDIDGVLFLKSEPVDWSY